MTKSQMIANATLLQERYLIRNQIGRGSMGAIYRAVDLRLDNEVAVKQIIRSGPQSRRAFAREARLLARLRHPALPKVTDHFADDNGRFLVMEYIPGDDLATAALKRLDPFPPELVIEWAIQLLAVLTYLHEQQPPVIHRDIKPHNLKLTAAGEVMLLDFGLAQKERPLPAAPDDLAGYTLCYAPPEQIEGRATDQRSDLYALAATLYDLATGVKPPDAVHHRQPALAAGRPDPLQPACEIQPAIPTAVSLVWQQAMSLNPDTRFASAQDMLLALQAARARAAAAPHNLPAQYTPLAGRQAEIQAIRRLFRREGARLLTLTGAAGIGKTRLGLQCAACLLEDFPDGVFFAPLAPLRDANLALAAIAQALNIKETGQKSLFRQVQTWLQEKRLLLLLDNFEHLLDAALLVTELLAACPQLKVLVTSRETLHLRGEYEFPVPPLALPGQAESVTAAEALQFTAVRLFCQRARAANPDFRLDDGNVTAVVRICAQLDGLPLAIELAAVHIKTMTPAQILARLTNRFALLRRGPRDLPPRQQALQAALDWSHDLLPPEEKKLFRRLAVFQGGFTQAAAEAVCQATGNGRVEPLALAISDGLACLVDKSLALRRVDAAEKQRYTMLVTVQAYAARRLAESGEAHFLEQRHAAYYLTLAEKVQPALMSAAPEPALTRLELEHDNLRAVFQWAQGNDVEVGYRLGDALWRFWQARGHFMEGRQWLDKLLAQNDAPTMARAKALSAAGNLAIEQGDNRKSIALHEESLALCRQLGNKRWESVGLNNLAIAWTNLGNYGPAAKWLKKSLALSKEAGNENGAGHTLNNLGVLALRQGNYQQAMRYLQESLSLFRKLADKRAICLPLGNLGEIAGYQGAYEQAVMLLKEALQSSEELDDKWIIAHNLRNLGKVSRDQGDSEQAAILFEKALNLFTELEHLEGRASLLNLLGKVAQDTGDDARAAALSEEALALCEQIDDKCGTAVSLQNLASVALHQENYDIAAKQYRQALALFSQLNHRLDIAVCLEELAGVASGQNEPAQAARLLGAANSLRRAMGAPLPPVDRSAYKKVRQTTRTFLGEEAFAAAWAEGEAMPLETAVALALSQPDNE